MAGVMSTPSTYGKGEQTLTDLGYATPTWYPNLAPDPGVDDTSYTPATVGGAYDQNLTQYRRTESLLGSGGSAAVAFTTAVKHGGTSSLALSVGTTASTTSWVTAFSPTYDVEPGATYVGSVWAATNSASVSRVYVRMAGGSTDALSEYTALSGTAGALPMTVNCENVNPGGSAINVFQHLFIIFSVPAGITRAAFRVYNYLPPTGMTVYFDDFKVTKLDNTPFCDTDWLPLPLANGWVDYGSPYAPPGFRKISGTVFIRGLLKNGTVTNNTPLATLPAGFRPGYDQINPGQMVTPGTGVARIDTNADGTIMGRVGLVAGWTSITLTPFVAEL